MIFKMVPATMIRIRLEKTLYDIAVCVVGAAGGRYSNGRSAPTAIRQESRCHR